jgi:hypothetical protein
MVSISRTTSSAVIGLCMAMALLSSCASATGYERASVWNDKHGWRDQQIGPDEFSVVVQGNVHTSTERVARIALLRAAHLTLEQGRDRFEVFNRASTNRAQDIMTTVPVSGGGMTVFVPVETQKFSEPVVVLLIRVFRVDSPPKEGSLDARAVVTALEGALD